MAAIVGTYQNGYVKFDKDYPSNNPVKVIVTFFGIHTNRIRKRNFIVGFFIF